MTSISPYPNSDSVQHWQRSGGNQRSVRHYNERLILDIISRAGSLSKADITRMTALSAQTVTVIVNKLIQDGLLKKMDAIKGRVGQPSTPIALNPDGAISLGIKLGRGSIDAISLSFTNTIIGRRRLRYSYPDPEVIFDWIRENVQSLRDDLNPEQQNNLTGIGIAAPFHLSGWEGMIGAPEGVMTKWDQINIANQISKDTGLDAWLINDASAACLAELRNGQTLSNSGLYYYIGTFLGGGIVLDGKLFSGLGGNAGSFGSMPQGLITPTTPKPQQMVTACAINTLEAMINARGLDDDFILNERPLTQNETDVFHEWSEQAASALAFVIISSQALLDTDQVVIDGSLTSPLIDAITQKVTESIAAYDTQGLTLPTISKGHLGIDARALGGAILPLQENFGLDSNLI
jgi:predicted NBD/HSP70 family sugar kinase